MKMIIAILGDQDNAPVTQALVQAGFRATRISSTGAFLRRGSSTLLIGVEGEKVEEVLQIIRDTTTAPAEPGLKRCTLFVLGVEKFTQI